MGVDGDGDLHVFSEIHGTRVTCQGWFWNQISSHFFRSIYISFTFISLHWMFTACLAVEVWYVKRCRRTMSKGDRVTFLGCCEGTIDDFDKDGTPVCFGFGTGHIGHTPFTLVTRCPECSQVFDLPGCDRSDVCYVLLCDAMCIYVTESQVVFLIVVLFKFRRQWQLCSLVHSNRTHEFLADNLMVTKHCGGTDVWCRSYLAACLGPQPIQYNPRNHSYVYIIA